uniref:G-protein coupled receptors family 1 profile domain-containing protein n=1 Tax=Leptobrachium leishanense TaxID=445787 RepID=A0A8C5N179_9ANUR
MMEENRHLAFTITNCFLNCVTGNNNNALNPGTTIPGTENGTMISLTCITAERLEWYCCVLIAVCFTSLVFGFLGNATVLLNYVHFTKSWTSSGIFLFNLAVCDFMWIIIVPISVYFNLKKPAYSEPAFCEFKRLLFNVNIYGSIFFLTLISFDRYLCSVHPLTSLRWWNKKKAKICTIAIWVFIFIESIPDLYYILEGRREGTVSPCLYYTDSPVSFVIPVKVSRFVLGFVIPGTVIFTCYFSSLKVLKHVKDQNLTRKKMNKPLMLISVTMVVFVISYVPYHVMMLILLCSRLSYVRNSETLSALYQLSEIICSVSSCADPLIFLMASNRFKHQLKILKTSFIRMCSCHSHRVGPI